MFDKFLCKKIHKEEITIKDVVRTLNNTIPFVLSYLVGVLILTVWSWKWPSSINDLLIIFGVPLITAIPISIILTVVGLIILKIWDIVGSVRIAKCPNKKE